MKSEWFAVDTDGLRKLIEDRGKALVLYELIQNAWDATDSTYCTVMLTKLSGRGGAYIEVRDDSPNGFTDLSHAYTLFAESEKKANPELRGRFNFGEKLVLALCYDAKIASTKGTIVFREGERPQRLRDTTTTGSVFSATVRMTQAEYDDAVRDFAKLIPPHNKDTVLNGTHLQRPKLIASFEITLPTLDADAEGVLRERQRKTKVEVFEVPDGQTASIYEMGIPIVETGDKYHVNIGQKVPLNLDRDNVRPAYLRAVRAAVLNHTATLLSKTDAAEQWVTNALESKDVEPEAVVTAVEARFGKDRAVWDPTDREANMRLVSRGFTVVSGGSLPKAAWENVRAAGAMQPSGRLAPTPAPYSSDPSAPEVEVIARDEWTSGMRQVEEITRWVAKTVGVHDDLLVSFVLPPSRKWAACYGSGLDYNVTSLGRKWFDAWYEHPVALFDLIIHELAHSRSGNHLDERYHQACTDLGAKLAVALLHGKKPPHAKLMQK